MAPLELGPVPLIKREVHKLKLNKDLLGITLSIGCFIHCVGLVLLSVALPTFTNLHEDELIHTILFLLVTVIAIPTFWQGYNTHRSKGTMIQGYIGVAFLGLAIVFAHESKTAEISLSIVGSILLVIAHVKNLAACKRCQLKRKISQPNSSSPLAEG